GSWSLDPSPYRISTVEAPAALTRPPMVTGEVLVTGSVNGIVTSIGSEPTCPAVWQTAPRGTPEVTSSVQCPPSFKSATYSVDEPVAATDLAFSTSGFSRRSAGKPASTPAMSFFTSGGAGSPRRMAAVAAPAP